MFFTAGGKLVPETGKVQAAEPARGALELLLKGPVASGHYTELPSGIKLEDVALADGTASVSFDPSFYAGGGSTGMQTRLAQVVYTLTQFPTVQNVRFLQDGQPARVAGGEGFPLNRPLTRSSFTAISA